MCWTGHNSSKLQFWKWNSVHKFSMSIGMTLKHDANSPTLWPLNNFLYTSITRCKSSRCSNHMHFLQEMQISQFKKITVLPSQWQNTWGLNILFLYFHIICEYLHHNLCKYEWSCSLSCDQPTACLSTVHLHLPFVKVLLGFPSWQLWMLATWNRSN